MGKWDVFLKLLEEKGIKYVFPKVPGLTDTLKTVWTLDDYVAWLKKIAEKEKGKIMLMGHSNGGRIALAFTHKYPQKVEKLFLVDSAGIYHNELPIKIKRVLFKGIAKVGKKLSSSKYLKNILYKAAREKDYSQTEGPVKQTMVNLISSDLRPILPEIKIPTVIIWGKDDTITPIADGRVMRENIKDSVLIVLEGQHHSPQFTNPAEVAKLIYEYI